jgi:hypothetical protein
MNIHNKYRYERYVHEALKIQMMIVRDSIAKSLSVDLKQQAEIIMLLSEQLLNCILKSKNSCPLELRAVYVHTYEKHDLALVGELLFRNFFCLAIMFPEQWGLWLSEDPPTVHERHFLVSISKVLQQIVSGKADESSPYKKLVEVYNPEVKSFLVSLCSTENQQQSTFQEHKVTHSEYANAVAMFNDLLYETFSYFPIPKNIEDHHYIHVLRAEEMISLMNEANSRQQFLSIVERFGNVIVPIEYVKQKRSHLLNDMHKGYVSITDIQLEKDLTRDVVYVNEKKLQCKSLTTVLQSMSQAIQAFKHATDPTDAVNMAKSILKVCVRTSAG